MKNRLVLILICIACAVQHAYSQDDSYSTYRKQMLENFQGFRKSVIDDYSKFLEGVWQRYDTFRGKKRDISPKPVVAPVVDDSPVSPDPVDIPCPEVNPVTPNPVQPQTPPTPVMPIVGEKVEFMFYGMKWNAPKINFLEITPLDNKAIAKAWHEYQKGETKDVIPILKTMAIAKGLNDWFTFQMVRNYSDAIASKGNNTERIVLQHFLLANMGYDVRIAKTENQMLLLVPFAQQVYERSYMTFGDKKYYVFYDQQDEAKESKYIYSCALPDDLYCGEALNLTYNCQNKIEYGDYKYRTLSDGIIEVNGKANIALMEMLRHYPQMDVPEYARSSIDAKLRKEILTQIGTQIKGLSQKDAANRLIHFVQYAFDYATDGEQHGYEKAYFIEENFYYPKNDCEDRAIFYAYLVRNLLGLDVHLVEYPGHECTAVSFTDPSIIGDNYIYEGKRFTICDPTYIGAHIGMCMPDYKNTKPKVELWY